MGRAGLERPCKTRVSPDGVGTSVWTGAGRYSHTFEPTSPNDSWSAIHEDGRVSCRTRRCYVVLLRAISNVKMQPFREALADLGFKDVESFGMSGNFFFRAGCLDKSTLERRIEARLGVTAFVRTHSELARIVTEDPVGSSVLILSRPPTAARRRAFARLDFAPPRPVLRGSTVYFVHPARLRGKRVPFDFELALDVPGTTRSARVVRQLVARSKP
jgi:Protein of unknown function (DUF1697)